MRRQSKSLSPISSTQFNEDDEVNVRGAEASQVEQCDERVDNESNQSNQKSSNSRQSATKKVRRRVQRVGTQKSKNDASSSKSQKGTQKRNIVINQQFLASGFRDNQTSFRKPVSFALDKVLRVLALLMKGRNQNGKNQSQIDTDFLPPKEKESFRQAILRQNAMTRDNYNYFVGDAELKRDIALRFSSKLQKQNYTKHLNQSNNYSFQCLSFVTAAISVLLYYLISDTISQIVNATLAAAACCSISQFTNTTYFDSSFKNTWYGRILKIILVVSALRQWCYDLLYKLDFIAYSHHTKNMQLIQIGAISVCVYQHVVDDGYGSVKQPVAGITANSAQPLKNGILQQLLAISVCMPHNILCLAVNVLVLPDWLEFACAATSFNVLLALKLFLSQIQGNTITDLSSEWANLRQETALKYLGDCLKCQLMTVFLFSLQEKTRKELFVVSSTNAKTKKQLIHIFDSIMPTCLVSKDGTILMQNQGFEQLLRGIIEVKPQLAALNVFKVLTSDAVSKDKLQKAIQRVIQSQQGAANLYSKLRHGGTAPKSIKKGTKASFDVKSKSGKQDLEDFSSRINQFEQDTDAYDAQKVKVEVIEIIFQKEVPDGDTISRNKDSNMEVFGNGQQCHSDISAAESYRATSVSQYAAGAEKQLNYYDNYEAMKLHLSYVYFKNQRAVMINVETLTDQKAKNRLIQMHTSLITRQVNQYLKKMEDLHKQLIVSSNKKVGDRDESDENIVEVVISKLGELLGNQQMTLNMVQQLDYYYKFISDQNDVRMENYTLSQEIEYCLDGLTARIRDDRQFQINLQMNSILKNVVGDISRFRMCFRTLLEFGIKYSVNNSMQVKCGVKEIDREKRKCLIQFAILLKINPKFDTEPLEQILNLPLNKESDASDKAGGRNFPGNDKQEQAGNDKDADDVSVAIEGQWQDISNKIANNYSKFMSFISDFGYGMIIMSMMARQLMGESYIMKLEGENYSDNDGQSNSVDEVGKIHIGFRLPFEPGASQDVQQTNYLIQTSIQEQKDGCKIFMTPGPTKKRLSDSFNNKNFVEKVINKTQVGQNANLSSLANDNLANNKSVSQAEKSKLNKPKVNNLRSNLVFQAMEDKQGQQMFFGGNNTALKTDNANSAEHSAVQDGSINVHTASNVEENSTNNEKDSNGNTFIKQQFSFIDHNTTQNQQSSHHQQQNSSTQKQSDQNYSACIEHQQSQGSQHSFAKRVGHSDDNDSNLIGFQKKNSVGSRGFNFKPRDPTEDNQPVTVPQGLMYMDSFMPIANAKSITEDLDSEKRDHVDSLFVKKSMINDLQSEAVASMDVVDSLMISSDDTSQVLSQNSLLRQSKDQSDLIERLHREHAQSQNKKYTLAKSMQLQFFNRFMELPCASKNKFGPLQEENQLNKEQITQNDKEKAQSNGCDPQVNQNVSLQKRPSEKFQKIRSIESSHLNNQLAEGTAQKQGSCDHITGRPLVNSSNVFLQGDEFVTKLVEEVTSQFSFDKYDCSVSYLKNANKSKCLKLKKPSDASWITKHKKYHQAPTNWNKNILMNPSTTNIQYDAGDHQGQLKNMKETLQKIENQHQQLNKLNLNKVVVYSNSTENSAASQNRDEADRKIGSQSQKSETVERTKQVMLIVEDNAFIQMSTQQQLDSLGVAWEAATDGRQAIDIVEKYLLQNKLFDIILMDLIMPVLDGYQASKEIRLLEQTYGLAQNERQFICGFSAQQRGLDVEQKCFDNGMDDIMQKPLNIEFLQKLLRDNDRRTQMYQKSNPSHSSYIANSNTSPVGQNQESLHKTEFGSDIKAQND